jgi:hypothetical protein
MDSDLQNPNPVVFDLSKALRRDEPENDDEGEPDAFDAMEIFDHIRHINDPEHPLTLEQLNVAQLKLISVDDTQSKIMIHFTPTIPHWYFISYSAAGMDH